MHELIIRSGDIVLSSNRKRELELDLQSEIKKRTAEPWACLVIHKRPKVAAKKRRRNGRERKKSNPSEKVSENDAKTAVMEMYAEQVVIDA